MSASLEPLDAHQWRLTVELPAPELERRVEARLGELRRTIQVHGFRPGKAPMAEVRRRAWDRVCQDEAERLAQSELRAALAARGLRPVAAPRLTLEGLPLARQGPGPVTPRVIATFEVFPPLPTIDLAALELEDPKVTIGEADVLRMLERLRQERRAWQPAEGELEVLRRQLAETMARELIEAVQAERLFLVEQALLARHPDLELPASLIEAQTRRLREAAADGEEPDSAALAAEARRLLVTTFLFAEIARQRGLGPDPTRLWQRTRELAERSDNPTAELDRIWGDGDRVQEIEEELLRREVVEVVFAEAQVRERNLSFSELAERRAARRDPIEALRAG